jgi:hypothetical protein
VTTLSVRGTREARQLLDRLTGNELQNRVRRGTRAGAKIMRTKVRSEAKARADIPDSFARTATKGHRTPVGTSTGPTSPLLNIFELGADTHEIGPGTRTPGALLLSGPAGERGRSRSFLASMPVTHPGMAARPLIAPVFEMTKDDASEAAMGTFLEGLR